MCGFLGFVINEVIIIIILNKLDFIKSVVLICEWDEGIKEKVGWLKYNYNILREGFLILKLLNILLEFC